MEVISTVVSLVALVVFVYLCGGAYLLIQDSELKYKVRKELEANHPDLTREEIRVLTIIKLKEMLENTK